MKERYILKRIEQRKVWDSFVGAHDGGHLLQSWGWGELKAEAGWRPLRLALWDTRSERIVAAAHVLRRGANRLPLQFGHLAYIPRGPVLDWSQEEVRTALFAQMHAYLRWRGALALRVELPLIAGTPEGELAAKCCTASGFRPVRPIQPARSILLDLAPDEEALLARMKEKWRYNVRLAGRRGVQVREAQTIDDLRAWYALLQTTSERDHFGVHTFDYYLSAWSIFAPRSQAQLLLAEHEGQLLAGIFVGLLGKQALYLYGASGNEKRHLMPNYLLQWEAMRRMKREGALCYDLWGIPESDREDEPLAGVYRFKSGWGGEVVRFAGCYEYIYRPLEWRLAGRFFSL